MLNLDYTLLQQVADQALIDASAHSRWVSAIGRALVELDTNPYLDRQAGHLLIGSPSGATYAANGLCSCEAYTHGRPCWHRAAARLVRRHDEQEAAGLVTMPEGDTLDQDGMRVQRQIAAARALAQINELFA